MTISPSLEEKLLRLLAEREIHEVLLRYCRGVDRCDRELMASCYHDDAHDDHGNWIQQGASNIVDEIARRVGPGPARPMHFLGNVLIEVEGNQAFAESYILAFRAHEQGGKSYNRCRAVRFVDRFELRNNMWKIIERVVVDEWNREEEVQMQEGSELFRYSSKDKHDPVYGIRRGRLARTTLSPSATAATQQRNTR
ncbi:nuclear transport factor 2 family protein [Variovorax guangxiensis]|uniref:nuclear transport factor 2 family protein n=1 Tax=Variovorax guangxiensis TaxID=1775474 RepID=UPI00286186FB|nr:nuclear transport factor 2 family protein [Variovorax guangxiensis]MDR6861543.1 hypothetical protein [Variovorax guangxiensis]